MPNDTPETIAVILAEMRRRSDEAYKGQFGNHVDCVRDQIELDEIDGWADRIEAAAERERIEREFVHKKVEEALSDEISIRDEKIKQSAPGNASAMRAALLSAARAMEIESRISCTEKGKIGKFGNTLSELCKGCRASNCECWQMTLKREVESALAAPARNCDVGTAEEQAERFIEFCAGHLCDNCPNSRAKRCGVGWSQMPFAPAEGGKE